MRLDIEALSWLLLGSGTTEARKEQAHREAHIVWWRYCSPKSWTLQMLANEYSVGKSMIFVLQARALRKLRHPTRRHFLLTCNVPETYTKLWNAIMSPYS